MVIGMRVWVTEVTEVTKMNNDDGTGYGTMNQSDGYESYGYSDGQDSDCDNWGCGRGSGSGHGYGDRRGTGDG